MTRLRNVLLTALLVAVASVASVTLAGAGPAAAQTPHCMGCEP